MTDLKKIDIDGTIVEVDGAMTILQACEVAGVETLPWSRRRAKG